MESQLKPEDTVNTIEELKEYIDMTPQEEEKLKEVIRIHPMRITKYYLSLIDKIFQKYSLFLAIVLISDISIYPFLVF